jgi:nitroreductase
MEFFDVIDKRRSVRAYRKQAIEPDKVDALLNAARLAPSAGDLQAYEIVLVETADAKAALAAAAHGQGFIEQAPMVLAFCADAERSEGKYGDRGAALYALQDATIAAAHLQLAATALGLASCWVGAFDEGKAATALRAPRRIRPVALMPIGYAAESPARPPRRDLRDLVRRGHF